MDIEGEINKLKKRDPDKSISMAKMAKILAATLDKAAVGWVSKVFWDKKFQQLADFDILSQAEKDRIFNELIIAPLALFMITLEAPDLNQPKGFRDYLQTVRDEIPKAHTEALGKMGIEKKYFANWEKLIKMRYEEYSDDKPKAREAMMEFESQEKALQTSDLNSMNLILPVFTVSVGCHHHICRGNTKGKDLLFKYLNKELSRLYVEFRILFEGGKVTPINRAKMKLRHFWNDLNDKQKN